MSLTYMNDYALRGLSNNYYTTINLSNNQYGSHKNIIIGTKENIIINV